MSPEGTAEHPRRRVEVSYSQNSSFPGNQGTHSATVAPVGETLFRPEKRLAPIAAPIAHRTYPRGHLSSVAPISGVSLRENLGIKD